MKFKQLRVGQWFDFVSPTAGRNSFWKRCVKLSARRYQDADGVRYQVSTVNCDVYHVV